MLIDRKPPRRVWLHWYAWYPVLPANDTLSWLEIVFRRKATTGGWEYRSTRSERERLLAQVCIPFSSGA